MKTREITNENLKLKKATIANVQTLNSIVGGSSDCQTVSNTARTKTNTRDDF